MQSALDRVARYTELDPAGPQPDGTTCLLWTGALAGAGRPCLRYQGKTIYVARLVLTAKLGRPLKRGKLAEHSCDNPLCVLDVHLGEGSFSSNLRAAWARKRRRLRPKTFSE